MSAIGRIGLALLLTTALLFSLVGTTVAETRPGGPPSAPFGDTYGSRFKEAVDALYALKIVAGKTADSYAPMAAVTRAQMAALILRALGKPEGNYDPNPFTDVPADYWAAAQIAGAAKLGIIRGGSDGLFRPNDSVTYPQAVAMILRALNLETAVQGDYPSGHVLFAKRIGLIDDLDWGLDKAASRGDVAIMLYRAIFTIQQGGLGATLSQAIHKRPGGVVIEPTSNVLVSGTTTLSARVVDWVGKNLSTSVTWGVTSGPATISTGGQLSVTGDAGAVTVVARAGEVSATKTFTVIRSLQAKVDKPTVSPGAKVRLLAVGIAGDKTEVAVTPQWRVISGAGTVSSAGELTVQGTSAVTVRAVVGPLEADTIINVVGGLSISPPTVTTAPNRVVRFTATVVDGAGATVNVPVTWSVSGSGSIDATGKFRSDSTPAIITAQIGDVSATAAVKILDRLEVNPSGGTFKQGDAKQFTATAYTTNNEPVSGPVQWDVEPRSVGFVSAEGTFFASSAGSAQVVASFGGLTAKVPVIVAGQATSLQITASPNSMPANGTSTSVITARLVDANGLTATGFENVFFSISSSLLGALDKTVAKVENGYASVTLTAGTVAANYSVIASVPGTNIPAASTSFSTTVPTISQVALEVYPNPVAADNTSQTTITAKLIDSTGVPIINNTGSVITVNLSASNTAAGRVNSSMIQIDQGQKSGTTYFTASNTPGTTVISGNSPYRVTSTTISSQVVGGAYKLKIRPGITATRADGTSEMVVQVEVQDANGNIRTGDSSVFVAMNATNGTNSIIAASQQTVWGVATFRLKATVSGQYTISVWSLNNNLIGDSASVSFTPGSAYKLSLTVDPSNSLAADGRTIAILRARILDVNNNLVVNAANQIRFLRGNASANITIVPAVTSLVASGGEATLTITATTGVGIDYFHAEADGLVISPQVSVSTRVTGVPVQIAVQSLQEATIAAGSTTTVRVWVLDQLNQLVTGDNGRLITLLATNAAMVSGPTGAVNGVATFTVTSTKAGGVGLTATTDGVTGDLVGRVLNVAPGTPDHIALSANPEALSADGISRATITAMLVDKYGNATSGSYAITLTLSRDDHLFLSSNTVITGGTVQATAKSTAGITTISGRSSTYAVTPLTLNTYQPGVPTRVVVDSVPTVTAGNALSNQVVVKARILDNNGNLVTSLNTGAEITAMALNLTGGTGVNTTNVTMNNNLGLGTYGINPNGVTVGSAGVTNGIATFTLTNTKAETVTLTPVIYYRGGQLQGVAGTFTTTPGTASRITVSTSATSSSATIPTNIVVTASVTDAYGNPTVASNDTITFSASNGLYVTMPAQVAIQTTTGTASITLTTRQHSQGGSTVITATSTHLNQSNYVTVVTDLPPDRPTISARDNYGTDTFVTGGEEGARIIVTVPIRNTDQRVFVYVNGVVVPLYVTVSTSTAIDTIPADSVSLTGFIKRSDLAGTGLKEIRAVIQTPLGMSPLSDAQSLNVQN